MRHLLGLLVAGCLMAGSSPAHGQSTYDLFGGARASALGYASTALTTASGVHGNPAAAARRSHRVVSFFAREAFGLSALRYGSVAGTWPAAWGSVSGGASTFGGDGYREVHYSLGYARGLSFGTSRHVHLGLTGRYYHTRIDGYGSTGAVGLHLGLLLPLLSSLDLGAHATNVNGPSLVEGEPLPQTLSVGLQYRAGDALRVLVDVFKDRAFPAVLRGGLEVRPLSLIALRAGVTTAPTRFTGGIGLHLGWLQAHVAAEQHAELGWTPSASLDVHW
ncbi:hypothetical protein [Salinibacter ruber]|uniref:PorV/PorQ family protein n=2 Tax=Salinibacter ruber TaxID=146919 RepID=D5H9E8_SALRM|nr:hypothetical protein [Salinibacter ruber]CBH24653.1 conserved hypothetical protein [Salinibacter ruber M8]